MRVALPILDSQHQVTLLPATGNAVCSSAAVSASMPVN